MNKEESIKLFQGPEKYNCIQAILKAFQKVSGLSDTEINDYKSNGGGKVEGGVCRAVYAAKIVNNSPEFAKRIDKIFIDTAGSIICKEIRKSKKLSCKNCVELAVKELTATKLVKKELKNYSGYRKEKKMTEVNIDQLISQIFDKKEFKKRCKKVAEAIGSKASALLQGAPRPPSAHPVFAQSKVFYYMCGIMIERSYLLINGKNGKITLFVPAEGISNVKGGILEGPLRKEICKKTVIDKIRTIDEMESKLSKVSTLYLLQRPDEIIFGTKFALIGAANMRAQDPFDKAKRRDELLKKNIKKKFKKIKIAELDPIISKLRLIKSKAEIELLRKNGKMSAKVCMECMKATKPGLPTATLNGIADYVFRVTGNCGQAYDFIMEPSTPTSDTLVRGDLVLVDCAPDNNNYAMDIGRIWPVNGKFNKQQRHVYQLIVDYHKTLLKLLKPGVMVGDLYPQAGKEMLAKYKGDKKGTEILNYMIERGIRYYNHHVGMAPHDAIDRAWRETPLKAGMVIAVDPMVGRAGLPYDVHGCVRVEDTVVLTSKGCEVLTGSAPFEIDDIEKLMKQKSGFPLDLTL